MLESIYIFDITLVLPTDVTVVPQSYKVTCVIAGEIPTIEYQYLLQDDYSDATAISPTACSNAPGVTCNETVDNGHEENGVSHISYDISPGPFRLGSLAIAWEGEKIENGILRQSANDGDHIIRCEAQRVATAVTRYSEIVKIRGKEIVMVPFN